MRDNDDNTQKVRTLLDGQPIRLAPDARAAKVTKTANVATEFVTRPPLEGATSRAWNAHVPNHESIQSIGSHHDERMLAAHPELEATLEAGGADMVPAAKSGTFTFETEECSKTDLCTVITAVRAMLAAYQISSATLTHAYEGSKGETVRVIFVTCIIDNTMKMRLGT